MTKPILVAAAQSTIVPDPTLTPGARTASRERFAVRAPHPLQGYR